MLEHKALKFYYDAGEQYICLLKIGTYDGLNPHYYPIYFKEGKFYFHIDSVVTFCHVAAPDEFGELTRSRMQKVFPNFISVTSKDSMRTFRYITAKEFEEIINDC